MARTAEKTRRPTKGRRSPDDRPILSAHDLVKDYTAGDTVTRALDGVSIDVPKGRFLSVMGPSGSGKSTLLHLLGGLDEPTSGEVRLGGKTLSGLPDKDVTLSRRGTIGFVFQFFNLVPVLTVEENIALPLVIDGRKPNTYRKRMDGLLRVTGLTDCAGKLPSEISGGQQQRTAIARALLPRPAVLLADEPTGNLDTKTGHQVLGLIKRAQRKLGQTVVMVTHDAQAAAFGDEIVYLLDGRVADRMALDGVGRSSRAKVSARAGHTAKERFEERAQAVLAWLQELGA